MAREVGRGRKRGIGKRLLGAGLVVAVTTSIVGCGSSLSSINPFHKEKPRLPGERIAVITDSGEADLDQTKVIPVAVPPARVNDSWTQPGGVPSNNLGHLVLNDSLQKIWSADVGTGSSSSGRLSAEPLVADGKVFTLDAGGHVSAFSAANGAQVWRTTVTPKNENNREGFGGGLALEGGRLYVTTGFGTVVALDQGSGSVEWTKLLGEPIRDSPTAAGGKVFFVSTDNTLYALNGANGEELWKARGLPETATLLSNASPAVSSNIVVAPYPAGDIAAFDAGTGKAEWTDSLSRTSETSASGVLGDPARPVIDRGVVFAVSHGGRMVATALSSGARVWTRNLASTQMPWVAGDAIYVVDITGKLLALGRSDGKVHWVTDLPQSTRWSGPVLAGGKVWVISGKGLLIGADARTGQVATQVNLDTRVFIAPVVAGGRMYILADNARLIALN